MTPEGRIRSKILNWFKKELPTAFVMPLSDKYHKGYPDLLVCYKGRVVFIEIKREDGKGKTSAMQIWTMNQIQQCGVDARVVKSLVAVQNIFALWGNEIRIPVY